MRLYSIHPKYLDQKGLCGLWAEANLAKKVLLQGEYKDCSKCLGIRHPHVETLEWCKKCKGTGKIKTPYYNHPALKRFKDSKTPIKNIGLYLIEIWKEGNKRGYKFDRNKIGKNFNSGYLTVTTEQLVFEFSHLQFKLKKRYEKKYLRNNVEIGVDKNIEPHPLFKVVKGSIEDWEKVKKGN